MCTTRISPLQAGLWLAALASVCVGCQGDGGAKQTASPATAQSVASGDPVNNPEIPQEQRDALKRQRAEDASRAAEYERQKKQ